MKEPSSLNQLDKEELTERCLRLETELEEQKATATSWIEALTAVAFTDQRVAKVLARTLEMVLTRLHIDAGYVHLLDPDEHVLKLRACVGISKAAKEGLEVIREGQRVPGKVLHQAKALIVKNISEVSDVSDAVSPEKRRMLHAGFPITWNGRILGTLTLLLRDQRELSREDLSTISALSRFMAGAVERLTFLEILSQGKRQWENAIDSVSDLIFICDGDFRIVRSNKAIFDRFWLPLEDVLGKECFKLIYNGNPFQISKETLVTMLQQGVTYSEEVTPSRWGGIFSIVISPILTFGKLAGSIHVIKEITHERLLEKDRGELAYKLSLFAPGTITTDSEGGIRFCDQGGSEILGYEEQEIQGQPISVLLPSLEFKSLLDKVGRGDGILDLETTALGKGGRPIQVALTVTAHQTGEKTLQAVSFFIRDMTHRQEDKTRFVQSIRLAAMREMAADMCQKFGHELKAVVGHIYKTEQSGEEPGKMAVSLRRTAVHARTLREILHRLGQFSEIDPEDDLEVLDSVELTRRIVEMIEGRWQKAFQRRGINFEFNPDQRVLPAVMGNQRELLQMLDHLTRNAVQAMPKGGKLILRTRTDRHWVTLALIDQGVGMTDAQLDRAFDPFFTTQTKNLGLGLSIAHGIVQRHHGEIAIHSRVGQGTTVTVGLPALDKTSNAIHTGADRKETV